MKPIRRNIKSLANRPAETPETAHRSLQNVKARIQIAFGLLAAVMVLVMAYQAGDLNMMREEMSLLKSISGWR